MDQVERTGGVESGRKSNDCIVDPSLAPHFCHTCQKPHIGAAVRAEIVQDLLSVKTKFATEALDLDQFAAGLVSMDWDRKTATPFFPKRQGAGGKWIFSAKAAGIEDLTWHERARRIGQLAQDSRYGTKASALATSYAFNRKHKVRRKPHLDYLDHIYFDFDQPSCVTSTSPNNKAPGVRKALADVFGMLGVPVLFLESTSSTAARFRAGDEGNTLPPTKIHVAIPIKRSSPPWALVHPIERDERLSAELRANATKRTRAAWRQARDRCAARGEPFTTPPPAEAPPLNSYQTRDDDYWVREQQRKYHYLRLALEGLLVQEGVFTPIEDERRPGVGNGFDPATANVVVIENLPARPDPNTQVLPHIHMLGTPGDPRANMLDLDAWCAATGYKPSPTPAEVDNKRKVAAEARKVTWSAPVDKKPGKNPTEPGAKRKKPRTVFLGNSSDSFGGLFKDVATVYTPTQMLRDFCGIHPTEHSSGGDYFYCPAHKEETNPSGEAAPNAKSLHTSWTGDRWRATCFGDCNRSWDTVSLYAELFGRSNYKAALELAEYLGFDLAKYKNKGRGVGSESIDDEYGWASEPAPVSPLSVEESWIELGAPEPERLPKLIHLARWFVQGLLATLKSPPEGVNPQTFQTQNLKRMLNAAVRCLVADPWGGPENEDRNNLIKQQGHNPLIDPQDLIEAIEWAAAQTEILFDVNVELEVAQTLQRLQKGLPCVGKRELTNHLPPLAIHELCRAYYVDCCTLDLNQDRRYFEFRSQIVSPSKINSDRYHPDEFVHAHELLKKLRMREAGLPWCAAEDGQELTAPQKKTNKRSQATENKILHTLSCGTAYQQQVSSFGRTGPLVPVLCKTDACGTCMAHRLRVETELVTPKWSKFFGGVDKQRIFFTTVILDNWEVLERVRDCMRKRNKAAKMSVLGTTAEGKIRLSWLGTDSQFQVSVRTAVGREWNEQKAIAQRLGLPLPPEIERVESEFWTIQRAIDFVLQERDSSHAYARHLIGTEGNTVYAAGWLRKLCRTHIVTARNKALPAWITLDEIQAYSQAKNPPMVAEPGETITWVMKNSKTHIQLLAQDDYPFSIADLGAINRVSPHVRGLDLAQAAATKAGWSKDALGNLRRPVGFSIFQNRDCDPDKVAQLLRENGGAVPHRKTHEIPW